MRELKIFHRPVLLVTGESGGSWRIRLISNELKVELFYFTQITNSNLLDDIDTFPRNFFFFFPTQDIGLQGQAAVICSAGIRIREEISSFVNYSYSIASTLP